MSRADGVLRVVLTGKWFDMIESGEKLEEYQGKHWAKRLLEAGDYFCFSIGLPLIQSAHPRCTTPSSPPVAIPPTP